MENEPRHTVSEKQLKVLAFPYSSYDAIIADGSIRSGKTSMMAVAFVRWAMDEFDGQSFIILGNTVEAASRNVVEPLTSMAYMLRRFKMDYNRGRHVLTVERDGMSNQFQVFGAKNDRSYEAIQGMTAAGCLVDEVAICNKKAVDTATARCSVDGSRLWFNCNPSYPTHWFREEWILDAKAKNALYLHFTMDDNPGLSEAIKERYQRQYRGVFHDRYIRGLWVVAEGLVYQFDSPDEYTEDPPEALDGAEWWVSIDYGITNPFAALLWAVKDGKAWIVDEYYFDSRKLNRRRTDSEHYEAVCDLIGERDIKAIVIDPSANSFKQEIFRGGRFAVFDADNAVVDGIRITDQMLHDGVVKVSPQCQAVIMEMQQYRWDDTSPTDRPVKENDHAMDAMRYMANTVLKYELGY